MTDFRESGRMKELFAKAKRVPVTSYQRLAAKIKAAKPLDRAVLWVKGHKTATIAGLGSAGMLVALTFGGMAYVKENTSVFYHVYVGKKEVGTVTDPKLVEQFILEKYKSLEQNNPSVHMVMNSGDVRYRDEKAYKPDVDNKATLDKLDGMLTAKAIGVKVVVNGKLIGVMKDKEEAHKVLEELKSKYTPLAKSGDKVGILSSDGAKEEKTVLESIGFVQKIEVTEGEINPADVMSSEELLKKVETGDVQPVKYEVKEGDTVSEIAKNFGISRQVIYENNPEIEDDLIRIGDELDLTVLQPSITVRTVEKLVETHEVPYGQEIVKDKTMRAGKSIVLSKGKNGLKKVTIRMTKANGELLEEEVIGEQLLVEPVAEVVKRGTKVIRGEGTGRFAWPVVGARITSTYGSRWGRLHAGIDLVSKNKSILAADNGRVTFAGSKNGYGKCVIIDHGNGYSTLYGHLSKINVVEGKIVEKGDKIGVMGNTGRSTGTHLHFEVHKNGAEKNPLKYLNR